MTDENDEQDLFPDRPWSRADTAFLIWDLIGSAWLLWILLEKYVGITTHS